MVFQVFPLSWLLRFFTFSRSNTGGRFASTMSVIVKKRLPCFSSSKPWARFNDCFLDTPAIENGWQGNPASRMSCFGIFCVSTLRISPANSWSISKFDSYVFLAKLSISLVKTHLPPIDSKPFLKPPIPAKRSIKSNFFCKIFNFPTWDSWIFLLLNSYLLWHRDL